VRSKNAHHRSDKTTHRIATMVRTLVRHPTKLRPVGAPLGAIPACIEEPFVLTNAFRAQGRSYKGISSTLKAPFHMVKTLIYALSRVYA
jgi:hypothetical protein